MPLSINLILPPQPSSSLGPTPSCTASSSPWKRAWRVGVRVLFVLFVFFLALLLRQSSYLYSFFSFLCLTLHSFLFYQQQNTEQHLKQKVPELARSLELVQDLLAKKQSGIATGMVRYNLCDNIYAKAQVQYQSGVVNLWLGANVMLEYTYEEAIHFLTMNHNRAETEYQSAASNLAFVRDQIVTSEVNMSRIYNWNVRKTRASGSKKE